MRANDNSEQSARRQGIRDSAHLPEPPTNEEIARRRRFGNLKRKLAMVAFHNSRRDAATGKSTAAQAGGRAAWRKRAAAHPGGARGLALDLAIRRWYGTPTAMGKVLHGDGAMSRAPPPDL